MADFSGAKYDGDFSMSLEDAQRRKHAYVIERLGIRQSSRVLDLGCGWGPLLNSLRHLGAEGIGVTLSQGQAAACRRNGLDVRIANALEVRRDTFGAFDAVASLGAFEHFCSPAEFQAGRQEQVYAGLFHNVRTMLEPGQVLPPDHGLRPQHDPAGRDQSRGAARLGCARAGTAVGAVSRVLAAVGPRPDRPHRRAAFPPRGKHQRPARLHRNHPAVAAAVRPVWLAEARCQDGDAAPLLTSADFRHAFTSGISPNGICFERELLDHFRIVFEAV